MTIFDFAQLLSLQTVVAFLAAWIAKVWAGRIARDEQSRLNERLKEVEAELKRQVLEHEVTFRRVDEKVADVLSETYERLYCLYECTTRYVNIGVDNVVKRREDTETANQRFCEFFFPKRLYIPQSLYERTNKFYRRLADVVFEFSLQMKAEQHGLAREGYWQEQVNALKALSDELFPGIVAEFQKRLGVKD